jgi:type VI secretion system protein ImpA
MATIDFIALAGPVSEAEPCGPDLDLAGDPTYMHFVARAEGLLPASFFTRDNEDRVSAFDRTSIDFDFQFDAINKLLASTRDLRLLVILAKFLILNRDLPGFCGCMELIARLLEHRWDDVHPRGEEGTFVLRTVALESLDDLATTVLPLQYVPLATSRRFGGISYRSYQIASGESKPREGEEAPDLTSVQNAFADADLTGLVATRDDLVTLQSALARITAVSIEQAGFEQGVRLVKLPPVVDKILAVVEEAVKKRDPTAALSGPAKAAAALSSPEGAESVASTAVMATVAGSVASVTDAARALDAVAGYFIRSEPSNPAVLLVRQARQLIGKSFFEVMQILVPAHATQASIHVGGDQAFELSVEQLSNLETRDQTDALGGSLEAGDLREQPNGHDSAVPGGIEAHTRPDALALLEQVGIFYRAMEPSSPIPLLTSRARDLAQRDFLSLLKDLLPEAALTQSNGEQ